VRILRILFKIVAAIAALWCADEATGGNLVRTIIPGPMNATVFWAIIGLLGGISVIIVVTVLVNFVYVNGPKFRRLVYNLVHHLPVRSYEPPKFTRDQFITLVAAAAAVLGVFLTWKNHQTTMDAERAWASVKTPLLMRFGKLSVHSQVAVEIVNDGKTQAHIKEVFMAWRIADNLKVDDIDEDDGKKSEWSLYVSHGDAVDPVVASDIEITNNDLRLIFSERKFLIVVGYIKYDDIYGRSHMSKYGFYFVPYGKAGPPQQGLFGALSTPKWSERD
jgi:hypothetical protein